MFFSLYENSSKYSKLMIPIERINIFSPFLKKKIQILIVLLFHSNTSLF